MAAPGRALFCAALARMKHTLSMLMESVIHGVDGVHLGAIYGSSCTPETPAENFAEGVVMTMASACR
jgi:hypothetical protein